MQLPSEVLGLGPSVYIFRKKQFSPQPIAIIAVRETVTAVAVSVAVTVVTVSVAIMVVVPVMAPVMAVAVNLL